MRIVVIGTTGSGKSHVAAAAASRLGIEFVELDALHWAPGWQEVPLESFRAKVAAVAALETWVIAGNYSKVRDLIWPRCDHIVWLDLGFIRCFAQLLARTMRRIRNQEVLWGTNRETFSRALLRRESILVWYFRTFRRNRRRYPSLLSAEEARGVTIVRLTNRRAVARWLESLPQG